MRRLSPPTPRLRRLLSGSPPKKPRVRDRAAVDEAAAERARQVRLQDSARWATSWMMPWERAQMDSPTRPLKLWERVYWRLFVVLGGAGFAYETWVLGNRRLWKEEVGGGGVAEGGLYKGNMAFRSQVLLSDEEVEKGVVFRGESGA